MTPSPLARAAVLLLLVWARAVGAEPWNGAEPGTTTLSQVVQSFGPPSRRATAAGEVVLTYQRKEAPGGARVARFRFSAGDGVLQRIEVTPTRPSKRAAIEALYGPAPEHEDAPRRQQWLHYRSRGVSVLVDRLQRATTVAYVAPEVERAPAVASVAPVASPSAVSPSAVSPSTVSPSAAAMTVPASGTASAPVATPASGLAPATVETVGAADLGLAPATVTEEEEEEPAASPAGAVGAAGSVVIGGSKGSSTQPPASDDSHIEGWREPGRTTGDAGESMPPANAPVLALGGVYYQRAELLGLRSQRKTSFQPTAPALTDLYLDATPSNRVRAYTLGRLTFDPLDTTATGPDILLGQLWLKFDIAQALFVTVGRQEIRWGSSQIWRPTDFLQEPRRNPLDRVDLRTGVDMVKVTLPWESLASNLSVIGTVDMDSGDSGLRTARYGGAVRAEVAVGPTGELIATAAFQQGRRPRYGLDLSFGVGVLDFNAEVALVRDSNVRLWTHDGDAFVERGFGGPKLMASGGVTSELTLGDIYRLVLRLEGFYNPLGYDDRALLTWLSSQGDFRSLYFGRYYAMGQMNLGRRGAEQASITFTTLANLKDSSFLSRLDFRVSPFDTPYIFFQPFIEVPYGARGSEFRFEAVPVDSSTQTSSGIGVFRAGLSLFMRI